LLEFAVTRHASRFSRGMWGEERRAVDFNHSDSHNSFVILVVIIMVVVDVLKCREIKNSM